MTNPTPKTARKTAAAKATPTAAPAPTAPTAAPAFDMAAPAAGVIAVAALPKVTRAATASSPFVALVKKSWDEKTALATLAMPAANVKAVRTAIRRAATTLGLGVSIRPEVTPTGVVITFQAKKRAVRPAKDDA